MKILITAFGPFAGRSENASSLALHGLKNACPGINTRILPVDAVIAPSRLKQAIRRLRPDALLMLGEAACSKTIRLESTAWNEVDFRIPDLAGRQITSRPISPGFPDKRQSTLPLAEIHAELDSAGHEVAHSDDPGRYLCNQLSFVAFEYLDHQAIAIPAGFIHLPLACDYPIARSIDALVRVIRILESRPGGSPA